ncbi:MAG: retroviral-like aspartic protease family protein [Desulfotalea sp.]
MSNKRLSKFDKDLLKLISNPNKDKQIIANKKKRRKQSTLTPLLFFIIILIIPTIYIGFHWSKINEYLLHNDGVEISFSPIWKKHKLDQPRNYDSLPKTTHYKKPSQRESDQDPYINPETFANRKRPQVNYSDDTEKLYSWIDGSGKKHFSNVSPQGTFKSINMQTAGKKSKNYTKAWIKGNAVYVPVTISLNGKYKTKYMLLDTGCSHTSIPYSYLSGMNPKWGRKVTATVANGETMSGYNVKIDKIKVGTKSMRNFTISAYKKSGSDNRGLLGMDFLKNRPFKIDYDNEQIIWL